MQQETERLHKDPRSNNSSCPARSAPPAWLTGLPGSLITSRCAVAKPTGKFPSSASVANFVFLLRSHREKKKKKKKLTTISVKAEVMLKDLKNIYLNRPINQAQGWNRHCVFLKMLGSPWVKNCNCQTLIKGNLKKISLFKKKNSWY